MTIRTFPITFLVLCTIVSGVRSQNTYSGTVTDRKGNPVAGVRVTDGDGAGTTTNLYGQYEIAVPEKTKLSFNLVGYNPRTIWTGPDVNVRLFKSRTLNSPNYGRHFFVGIQAATAEKSLQNALLGVNLGVLKSRIGWYFDFVFPPDEKSKIYCSPYHDSNMDYCLTGKRKSWAWHCSTGFMVPAPVINSLYLSAGAKYCKKRTEEECYYEDENWTGRRDGCSLELGLSYRISHFMLNTKCGALYVTGNDSDSGIPSGSMRKFDSLSFGLSYIF